MLDLSGLLDRASELLSGGNFQDAIGADLTQHLTELGVDSSLLDGVQVDDLQNLLDNSGIDVSALGQTELGEIIATVKENGGIEGIDIKSLFDRSTS